MRIATTLFLSMVLVASAAMAQYPVVTIEQIQSVPVGRDSSFYAGDTVVTGGLVVAGTGLYYAGAGVTFYMEDPAGGPFSGIMAYNPQREGFPELIPGDSVMCTALVSEYVSAGPPFVVMTELFIVPGTFQYRMYGMPEPDPIIIPASVIDSTANADSTGEQWEGVFVQVRNLTVDTVINYTTTSTWICHDSTGRCFVREASDSIPNSFRPPAGTVFAHVQGVIYHRFGAYHLQPRYMRDMSLGRGAPIVTATWNRPAFPLVGDIVTISANVVDDSHVDTVRLDYRINLGSWIEVPMAGQANDVYTFQLPSPQANWDVDYYIRAVDDSHNVTLYPVEAPFSFRSYRVQQPRVMTIAEARVDVNGDFVPDKKDTAAVLTGIAVSPNFSTSRTDFYLQQGAAGINVYFDSTTINVSSGDSITVNGIIGQYNGKTQIVLYRNNRMTNNGPGHLPAPRVIRCTDLVDVAGEAIEGTLVLINDVEIVEIPDPWPTMPNQSATMTMVNGADSATLRIDRYTNIPGQPQQEPRANITGIVSQYDLYPPYSGYYEFMPRFYSDFVWVSGVDEDVNVPYSYALMQNYPNPFNPATSISFSLKEKGHVEISVFNLLGEKVTRLVDQDLGPGEHTVIWDGTNANGGKVSSGVYFYRMTTDNFVATKKMVFLK